MAAADSLYLMPDLGASTPVGTSICCTAYRLLLFFPLGFIEDSPATLELHAGVSPTILGLITPLSLLRHFTLRLRLSLRPGFLSSCFMFYRFKLVI
jgi:hypothetical protein